MTTQQSTTQTMKITDVKQQLSRLVDEIDQGQTRVVIEKNGSPIASLVSMDDLRRLERWDQERVELFKILEEIGAAFADVPAEELEREVERALAEVRAERRAEQAQVVGANA